MFSIRPRLILLPFLAICFTWIRYQLYFGQWLYSKSLSGQCSLTIQIEPVQDKIPYNVYRLEITLWYEKELYNMWIYGENIQKTILRSVYMYTMSWILTFLMEKIITPKLHLNMLCDDLYFDFWGYRIAKKQEFFLNITTNIFDFRIVP